MTRRDLEAPLTDRELRRILKICAPHGLLVGGQALAFWADRLDVSRPAALESGVTADADFIGDASLAQRLGRELGWKTWLPTLDDASPQTGKVTRTLPDGTIKQVDFLSGVAGLTTKDLNRRAVELVVPNIGRLRVLHPVDVLDSRIQNLRLIPAKRNQAGLAQAQLAIDVVRTYIAATIQAEGERAGLRLLERVVSIASDLASRQVFLLHGIDPLLAVPIDEFRSSPSLHRKRWPQVLRDIARQRTKLSRVLTRPTI
jgi:hypothetical protein